MAEENPLTGFLRRVETEPFFAGWHIARHGRENNLSRAEIAGQLGITLEQLDSIRLCRKPEGRHEAAMIAERFAPADRFEAVIDWLCEVCGVPADAG